MAEKKFDVIHIGEANHDIRVPGVPDDFLTGSGETYLCGRISDGCGGDALNQAICLASLGEHSAFCGRLNSGYPGVRLKELLEEQGVDTSLIVLAEDSIPGEIIVNVMKGGAHRFLVGERKNWGPRFDEIDPEIFGSAKFLAIGSLYVLDSLDRDRGGLETVLRICRREGVTVVADMTYDIHSLGPHFYDQFYEYMDYVVPSKEEAAYVSGETDERKMAAYFLEKGARNVIIKLGSKGSYFCSREKSFYMGAFLVEPVDTTGCGDNFTAGLIHSLLKGLSIEESMRFASAAGALNSLGIGSSSYIRSEQMVLDFIKKTIQINSPKTLA